MTDFIDILVEPNQILVLRQYIERKKKKHNLNLGDFIRCCWSSMSHVEMNRGCSHILHRFVSGPALQEIRDVNPRITKKTTPLQAPERTENINDNTIEDLNDNTINNLNYVKSIRIGKMCIGLSRTH